MSELVAGTLTAVDLRGLVPEGIEFCGPRLCGPRGDYAGNIADGTLVVETYGNQGSSVHLATQQGPGEKKFTVDAGDPDDHDLATMLAGFTAEQVCTLGVAVGDDAKHCAGKPPRRRGDPVTCPFRVDVIKEHAQRIIHQQDEVIKSHELSTGTDDTN